MSRDLKADLGCVLLGMLGFAVYAWRWVHGTWRPMRYAP